MEVRGISRSSSVSPGLLNPQALVIATLLINSQGLAPPPPKGLAAAIRVVVGPPLATKLNQLAHAWRRMLGSVMMGPDPRHFDP